MEVKTGGGGGAAGRSTSPSPAQATPIAPSGTRVLGRQDSTSAAGSFDAWLVQKLKAEWSSDELGALLTRERIVDALASFPQLENPIKVKHLRVWASPGRCGRCTDGVVRSTGATVAVVPEHAAGRSCRLPRHDQGAARAGRRRQRRGQFAWPVVLACRCWLWMLTLAHIRHGSGSGLARAW